MTAQKNYLCGFCAVISVLCLWLKRSERKADPVFFKAADKQLSTHAEDGALFAFFLRAGAVFSRRE